MAISMLKIRRPLGRLIFNMGIAIPGKTVFLIETAPKLLDGFKILIHLPHYLHPNTDHANNWYDNSTAQRNTETYYWKQAMSLCRFQPNTLRLWYTFCKWCTVTTSVRIDWRCHCDVVKVITLSMSNLTSVALFINLDLTQWIRFQQ